MLNYLTRAELTRYNLKPYNLAFDRAIARRYSSFSSIVTVFLSHSHKDAGFVENAAAFLKSHGAVVYVDWLDREMPAITSPETAKKLKEKISEHRKFILLATDNSKESSWIPWELGIADTKKGLLNIAILPIAESSSVFKGTEFVGIYPVVQKSFATGEWVVWCHELSTSTELSSWLSM